MRVATQHTGTVGEVKTTTWGFVAERASCDIRPLSATIDLAVGSAVPRIGFATMLSGGVMQPF